MKSIDSDWPICCNRIPALRAEIEADATLNALLRFMTDVRQTDDQFVQGVLDQCSAMPPRALPNVEVNPIERQFAGLSDKSDPLGRSRIGAFERRTDHRRLKPPKKTQEGVLQASPTINMDGLHFDCCHFRLPESGSLVPAGYADTNSTNQSN